jgi:hypothetical protein
VISEIFSFLGKYIPKILTPEAGAIILSAYLVYRFGAKAYKNQKNYEEIRDSYLKDGLETLLKDVTACIETIYYNYEALQRELKYIRDYEPTPQICFSDIQMAFKEYMPSGFALRSIYSVEYLLDNDIFKQRILTFFGSFRGTLILFDEVNLAIKKAIENAKDYLPDEKTKARFYDQQLNNIDKKLEEVSEDFYLQNVLIGIINIIRDRYCYFSSLKILRKRLRRDKDVQEILSIALWQPVVNKLKKSAISITEFLGVYTEEKEDQKKKLRRWDKFRLLITKGHAIPCSYNESTAPPQQKDSATKWKEYLSAESHEGVSEAYKLTEGAKENIIEIRKILF